MLNNTLIRNEKTRINNNYLYSFNRKPFSLINIKTRQLSEKQILIFQLKNNLDLYSDKSEDLKNRLIQLILNFPQIKSMKIQLTAITLLIMYDLDILNDINIKPEYMSSDIVNNYINNIIMDKFGNRKDKDILVTKYKIAIFRYIFGILNFMNENKKKFSEIVIDKEIDDIIKSKDQFDIFQDDDFIS